VATKKQDGRSDAGTAPTRHALLGAGPPDGARVLAFLSEASKLLASSLEVDATLQHAARLTVPPLGDWCVADLVEPDGSLRRVAVVHRNPDRVAALWALSREYPTDPAAELGPAHVVRVQRPEFGALPQERLAALARDERQLALLKETGIHSFLSVPLRARDRVLGALTLAVSESARQYQAEDLPLVEELAGRIAMALDNALLFDASQRAEAVARQERARLETVVQSIPLAVVIAEAPSGRMVLGNRSVAEIIGRPVPLSDALEAYREWRGYHPDGRPVEPLEYPLARAMTHGEVVRNEEMELERPDGSRVSISASAAPIREDGRISGAVVVFNDITERLASRRKVEALATQLANQQRWLESLLDLSPVPLVLVEPHSGAITYANRAADALAGGTFPRQAPQDREPAFRRMTSPDGEAVAPEQTPMSRAIRGEKLENVAIDWHLPGGARSLLVSSERLPAMFGHPETIVISYQDVTELRRTQEELERSLRTRDDFLSVAAHELRTPITSLRLYTQTLVLSASRGALDPKVVGERARNADRQVGRLARLVESLLDLTRIQSGKLQLHPEPLDLVQVVADVVSQVEEEARRAGCELRVNLPPSMPGSWDRLRVEQVVANLLSNAFKYGANAPVELSLSGGDGGALIEVRDQGIGIAPEDQARLFQRFERAVSDRHYGGFGLGLWIVRQIVNAMGGGIDLESLPGQGATFRVALPAAAEAPPRPAEGSG
jgi:PAS domain S-box-containing protein